MRFEFATATQIVFGAGTVRELPALARSLGRRALLVTGKSLRHGPLLLPQLAEAGIHVEIFIAAGEPTLDLVRAGAERARQLGCDLVVAVGGGSSIDAGKAIAALATNVEDVLNYLEVIGASQPLVHPPLPFIALPTTAGAGAEVTRNAVLTSPDHRTKASLRSPLLLPRAAVVDPELTLGLPPALTASTGLDALTQLIEPFLSLRANPLTDGLCREGLDRVARSLARSFHVPDDLAAREDLALASLFSGLALANAGLGAVHGFAAPIGGMFPAPHGAVCAALLPHALEINLRALRARQSASPALARYEEIARRLTLQPSARAEDAIAWVRALVRDLGIPPLAHYGLARNDVPELCQKAAQASSMKGNPLPLTPVELEELLTLSL